MTQAMVFSADDGCDFGEDTGAPVSPDYGSRGNAFNGRVKGVQLAIAEAAENSDHLVSPEDAIRMPWSASKFDLKLLLQAKPGGRWPPEGEPLRRTVC